MWVITPSWFSGSWRCFLYSSSVYSCHLFLISSAYVRSIPFLSFIVPIFAWSVPLVSLIFLKRSLIFPILLFSSISLQWSMIYMHWFLCIYTLLLLNHVSCVQLWATPETAAHQAPPSLGFSRQEHWSGFPFPSPMHESEKWKWCRSVMSDS